MTLLPSEIPSQRNVWKIWFYHVGTRLELHLLLDKWLQAAKVSDLTGKILKQKESDTKYWSPRSKENKKQNQYRGIWVQDTQREWECRRLKKDRQVMCWKSLSCNFEKHNHLRQKGNVCSYWRQGFPIKQSYTKWLQQIQGPSVCRHYRKELPTIQSPRWQLCC